MSQSTPPLHPNHDLNIITNALLRASLCVDYTLAVLGRSPTACPACNAEGLTLRMGGHRYACRSCQDRGSALRAIRLARPGLGDFLARAIGGSILLSQFLQYRKDVGGTHHRRDFADFAGTVLSLKTAGEPAIPPFCYVAPFCRSLRRSTQAHRDVLTAAINDLEYTAQALRGELSAREVRAS